MFNLANELIPTSEYMLITKLQASCK